MSASSSTEPLSKKFASIYASLPPDAQKALLEQHLLPLLDKENSGKVLDAAETLKTRFLGLPSLRLTERTRLTSRLIHDLERAPHHAALLDELCDTLSLWCQDIFSVVFEYRTSFKEAHECLLVMSKVVGEAGEACMGVAGCHCATTQLPFDVVFDRRRSGKRVRHVQCSGLDAFEVKVLRWLWREVCVGALREEGEGGEEKVREWLGDVEDVFGWRGVVGVLYGGRTRWDDVDEEFEDEDEVLDDDEDSVSPSDEEDEEEEEIVSDDGAEGWEDDSSISLPHPHLQRSDPFIAPHWSSALISRSPTLHTLAISHLTALFARAPCAELFSATTTLSPSSRAIMLSTIEKTALSAPGSLAPSLAVLLHEPFPDAPRIWSLLESGRHLLRPRDAPTLQHIASTLGSIASERKKSQELVSRELIQSARSVHASLLSIFPRLDEPRTKKDLARILRTPAGEINRAQAIRDWVRSATRGGGGGMGGPGGMGMNVNVEGLGNIGVGVGAGPGAAQMAALAQMMGFPVPAEALEVVEDEDAAMAMGLGVRSREERAEMALLKERFHGWVDVAVALGRSQVLLIKAYHDMGPFMPYIKDTEVCAGVMSALADRAADSTLDALDALDSFAKAQRKREAALKARKEKEEARKKREAAGEAGPSSGGSGSAGGKKTKTGSTSRASGSGSTSTSASAHPSSSTHVHNHPPPPHPFFSFGWTAPPHAGESDDDDMPPLEPIGGVGSSSNLSTTTAPPPHSATGAGAGPGGGGGGGGGPGPGPQFFVNPAIANAFGPGSGGFVHGAGPTPAPNNPHLPHAHALPPNAQNPLAAALSAMFGLAMNQALNVQGAGGEGDEGGDSDSSGEGPPALMPAERGSDSDGEMPALERVGGGGGGVETGYHGIEDVD